MADETFRFEGGRELEAAFAALAESPAIRRAALAALHNAAEPILTQAKSLVPVDQANLQRSLKKRAGKRHRGDDGDQVRVTIGIDTSVQEPKIVGRKERRGTYRDPGVAGVGPMQEFGTPRMPATPFMRPAWDAHKDATPDRIGAALGPAIEAEGARLARKRARGR